MTSDEALKKLLDGNARFVSNQMTVQKCCDACAREALAAGQQPPSIVLCCSDSRVPPELIFDQGLGEIFVVRVAGNVLDPIIIGSIEYAADHLGSSLILVLGHERCGAVTAAVDAHGEPHGHVGEIVKMIAPAVHEARKLAGGKDKQALIEEAADSNVRMVSESLAGRSHIINKLVAEKKIKIVPAKYHFDGKVNLLEQ